MTPEQEKQIDSLARYFFLYFNRAESIPQPTKDDLRCVEDDAHIWARLSHAEICGIDDIVVDQSVYDNIAREIRDQVNDGKEWGQIICSGSSFFDKYIERVAQNEETRSAVKAIMERLNDLLKKDREQDTPTGRTTGLVVGRVQSGKTQNFTGLALKAVSEKWNMILVLTSCNTALADQTKQRLKDDFAASGIRPINTYDAKGNCRELDFLKGDGGKIAILSHPPFFYWGVAMKETRSLQRVIDFLERSKQVLGEIKLLVIDDEADNATPNSAAGKNKLTEDQIKEHIGLLRDSEGGENPESPAALIANWLERLGELEITEGEENALKNELNNLTGKKLPTFLENHGETLDLDVDPQEILKYYTGKAPKSRSYLIKVLKSIFDIAAEQSTINRKIRTIVDRDANGNSYPFKNCAYVGYTATPYANIFHERPDQTPIYPGFIYSLGTGKGYFGLNEIFGSDPKRVEDSTPRMPIVCQISKENEKDAILTPLQKTHGAAITEIPLVATNENSKEWAGLKTMIKWAFCSAAARRHYRLTALAKNGISQEEIKELEKTKARWTSMLVHIDRTQKTHGKVKGWIIKYLTHVTDGTAAQETFREECLTVWNEMKKNLTAEIFQDIFKDDDTFKGVTPTPCPTRETIEPYLKDFIQNCHPDDWSDDSKVHVIEINSSAEGKNAQCSYTQSGEYKLKDTKRGINDGDPVRKLTGDHLWIISGGNTIARGLTLDGLTSSYFDRAGKSVAVDTLTQMGRWFGYRRGYELLPRLALTDETVKEIKKIAVIEDRMHREIKKNFENNIPPDDPDGYLIVYTCGRKLSGRQKALCQSRAGGEFPSTDYLYHREYENNLIFEKTENFLKGLSDKGMYFKRDKEEYEYSNYRLWQDVPKDTVRDFLNGVKNYYPKDSESILGALATDIDEASDDHRTWYVVIGEPDNKNGDDDDKSPFALEKRRCGEPRPKKQDQGNGATYHKLRLHLPYHAMIPKSTIRKADLKFLSEGEGKIIEKWQKQNVPENMLKAGSNLADRLHNTLDYYAHNNEPLPSEIHSLLNSISQGLRNRSDRNYLLETHRVAPYNNPILQIYLIKPPEDKNMTRPLIALSAFWPDHEPTGFVAATLGLAADVLAVPTGRRTGNNISQEQFYTAVRDILLEAAFPLPPAILTQRVFARLGCDRFPYSPAIREMQLQYGYRKLPGGRYCPLEWAKNLYNERLASPGLSQEESAVINEFFAGKLLARNEIGVEIFWGHRREILMRPLQKVLYDRLNEVALEVLKDDPGNEIFTKTLMNMALEKIPEFEGFTPYETAFNKSFSAYIENQPVEDIRRRTQQHPTSQCRRYVYRQANPENTQEEQ